MTDADPWQLLPALSDAEYANLKADIAAHGVRVPIVKDGSTGATIDGHHRLKAVAELREEGIAVKPLVDVRRFEDDEDRVGFVVSSNLFRRHLTREQRVEVVASLRARGWSLRRIGQALGVDHTTVRGDVSQVGISTPVPIVGKDVRCSASALFQGRALALRVELWIPLLHDDVRI